MARIIIFISVFTFCLSCDETDSEIKIDPYILANYLDDTKDLYMREIAADPTHPNYNIATLDTVELTKITTGLHLIYKMHTPESDTVFELYEIHALKALSFNSIYVKVNPDLPEIINLSNEVIPTGNATLDALLNKYKFYDVSKTYNYPTSQYLVLNSQKDYNLFPVIKEFKALNLFLTVENNGYLNFLEDDIDLTREGDDLIFDFRTVNVPNTLIKFRVRNKRAEYLGRFRLF